MTEQSINPIARRALHELYYALLATGITVAFSVGFYIFIPKFAESLRNQNADLIHPREFKVLQGGGEIIYKPASNITNRAEELVRLKRDLEILSVRFRKGHFDMVSLPGMRESRQVVQLKPFVEQMRYTIVESQESVSLKIETVNPAAVQAVHEYLKYLELHWK